jgi:hypothetical protein
MKEKYEPPALTTYGSVVSLTMGAYGSAPKSSKKDPAEKFKGGGKKK